MYGGSSQVPTTPEHCFSVSTVLNDLITARSAVVGSWEEPNIWLTVAKNAFVGKALNLVPACYWKAQLSYLTISSCVSVSVTWCHSERRPDFNSNWSALPGMPKRDQSGIALNLRPLKNREQIFRVHPLNMLCMLKSSGVSCCSHWDQKFWFIITPMEMTSIINYSLRESPSLPTHAPRHPPETDCTSVDPRLKERSGKAGRTCSMQH